MDESKKNEDEIERLHFENEQLRGMLHSLLLSVESDSFVETMRDLDDKVSTLLGGGAAASESEDKSEASGSADTDSAINIKGRLVFLEHRRLEEGVHYRAEFEPFTVTPRP